MYNGIERKKLRFINYNYSYNGFYFITICTKNRENYFGEIIDGKMILNDYGEIVEKCWQEIIEHYQNIKINEFVIMPNHIHLIIIIGNNDYNLINKMNPIVGCDCIAPNNTICKNRTITRTGTMQSFPTGGGFDVNGARGLKGNHLSSIIRGLKSSITKQINELQDDFQFAWQKSFYDVIIKNDEQLQKTRQYIFDNPIKWKDDVNNPINIKQK